MRCQHIGIAHAIQNQVIEKRLWFPAGVSRPPGEGRCKSLQTEHTRQVGTKSHSLGGPAIAKITDKLTYKASFYFVSKPQRLPAEPPAGEQHEGMEASPAASAQSLGHLSFLEKRGPQNAKEKQRMEGGGSNALGERTPVHHQLASLSQSSR